ncbi:MAG TPA: class I SAM-dependent methyltransferase, partial [Ramlibacter sp.]
LVDNSFFCAPGTWTAWRCLGCDCAYLDPRPDSGSIHLAYVDYYTHRPIASANQRPRGLGALKRALTNGYKNWRFGVSLQPSAAIGAFLVSMVPSKRVRIDRQFRHLPHREGKGRVLDVGFGSGAFLDEAQLLGWDAVGVDIDPTAVANARARGLNVFAKSLDHLDFEEESFDVITISHVLEHVHDPVALLRTCFRLLRPGGMLWIETPNIDSVGHARFGRHWRGLEPPRHLVIFGLRALRNVLSESGFVAVGNLAQPSPCSAIFRESHRIASGLPPEAQARAPLGLLASIAWAKLRETWSASRREFLAVTAVKPVATRLDSAAHRSDA